MLTPVHTAHIDICTDVRSKTIRAIARAAERLQRLHTKLRAAHAHNLNTASTLRSSKVHPCFVVLATLAGAMHARGVVVWGCVFTNMCDCVCRCGCESKNEPLRR